MSWFKTLLLLGVLGMTWAECDRPPASHTRFWPETAGPAAATNALERPARDRREAGAPVPAASRRSAAPPSSEFPTESRGHSRDPKRPRGLDAPAVAVAGGGRG